MCIFRVQQPELYQERPTCVQYSECLGSLKFLHNKIQISTRKLPMAWRKNKFWL
jgi:hypothetical protein